MKKIMAIVSGIALYCNIMAVPSIEDAKYVFDANKQYLVAHTCNMFVGKIMLESKILVGLRHLFVSKFGNPTNPLSKSVDDESKEPIADLVIQLFPSANQDLNAEGTNSFSDLGFDMPKLVAFAFRVAQITRDIKAEIDEILAAEDKKAKMDEIAVKVPEIARITELAKAAAKGAGVYGADLAAREDEIAKFVRLRKQVLTQVDNILKKKGKICSKEILLDKKIFSLIPDYIRGLAGQYFQNLEKSQIKKATTLGSTIAKAVIEESEKYPSYFVNYVISAYAWSVFTKKEQMEEMYNLLTRDNNTSITPTASFGVEYLVKNIVEMYNLASTKMFFPISPGEFLISNGATTAEGEGFQDCVETAIRQFFAILLCKREESGVRVIDTAKLFADSLLSKAFAKAPNEIKIGDKISADAFMNNGSPEVRNWWATSVSKIDGVKYARSGTVEVESDSKNVLRVICGMLKGETIDGGLRTIINTVAGGGQIDVGLCFRELSAKFRPDIKVDATQMGSKVLFYAEEHKDFNNLELRIDSRHSQMHNMTQKLSPQQLTASSESWLYQIYTLKGKNVFEKNASFPILKLALTVRADIPTYISHQYFREKLRSDTLQYIKQNIVRKLCWDGYIDFFLVETPYKDRNILPFDAISPILFSQKALSQVVADDVWDMLCMFLNLFLDPATPDFSSNIGKVKKMAKREKSIIGACVLKFLLGECEIADAILKEKIFTQRDDGVLQKDTKLFWCLFRDIRDKLAENRNLSAFFDAVRSSGVEIPDDAHMRPTARMINYNFFLDDEKLPYLSFDCRKDILKSMLSDLDVYTVNDCGKIIDKIEWSDVKPEETAGLLRVVMSHPLDDKVPELGGKISELVKKIFKNSVDSEHDPKKKAERLNKIICYIGADPLLKIVGCEFFDESWVRLSVDSVLNILKSVLSNPEMYKDYDCKKIIDKMEWSVAKPREIGELLGAVMDYPFDSKVSELVNKILANFMNSGNRLEKLDQLIGCQPSGLCRLFKVIDYRTFLDDKRWPRLSVNIVKCILEFVLSNPAMYKDYDFKKIINKVEWNKVAEIKAALLLKVTAENCPSETKVSELMHMIFQCFVNSGDKVERLSELVAEICCIYEDAKSGISLDAIISELLFKVLLDSPDCVDFEKISNRYIGGEFLRKIIVRMQEILKNTTLNGENLRKMGKIVESFEGAVKRWHEHHPMTYGFRYERPMLYYC
ncbi:MAG: hypothetical protein LBB21_01055 [Holosporaceae bacterium]|jgi:hypothetical protein|nr:hypothetical protein [Holosporaceae bacterium]